MIEDAWCAQPLHYYLRPDLMMSYEHATLGTPDGRARFADHVERAWVVGFGSDSREIVGGLSRPLTGYRALQFVSAVEAGAVLLERER